LIAALFAIEVSAPLIALGLYKFGDRLAALSGRQWAMLIGPAALFLVAAEYVRRAYRRSRRSGDRRFMFTLAMNLFTVVAAIGLGETIVRVFTVPTPFGPSFGGTVLMPKQWAFQTERSAALLRSAPANISYVVPDTLLGWSVGPKRRSSNGLYFSSAEGIRSASADTSFAGTVAPTVIAAVGDSFTFGLDGSFEETWGFYLERALGRTHSVLNFGVDGFGVDQAYLRYTRDARPWRPAVSIFGFIDHDLSRTLSVYPFISFPTWGMPFTKPRFVLDGGVLRLLNVPLLAPHEIITTPSVGDLPFVAKDPGYWAEEWQWRSAYSSSLLRFVISRFPRWRRPDDFAERVALNTAILRAFAQRTLADGSVPLVVYFPSRGDFHGDNRSEKDEVLAALSEVGVQHLDLTECIARAGGEAAFRPDHGHYTAAANAAAAQCILPSVKAALAAVHAAR
jgi:hypothetical protein